MHVVDILITANGTISVCCSTPYFLHIHYFCSVSGDLQRNLIKSQICICGTQSNPCWCLRADLLPLHSHAVSCFYVSESSVMYLLLQAQLTKAQEETGSLKLQLQTVSIHLHPLPCLLLKLSEVWVSLNLYLLRLFPPKISAGFDKRCC